MKKEESPWIISPFRCKYAQIFELEVILDGGLKGTRFERICTYPRTDNQENMFYKCCKKNCPPSEPLELLK
jgi:hypothetical protein